ncbi:hypothetical protein BV20DRAFT_699881 [Pilatotrama ljubarskyi]|nr:hypothetical protein BV20DRAFT_699881 [Pilatotrama ljubarskyi]
MAQMQPRRSAKPPMPLASVLRNELLDNPGRAAGRRTTTVRAGQASPCWTFVVLVATSVPQALKSNIDSYNASSIAMRRKARTIVQVRNRTPFRCKALSCSWLPPIAARTRRGRCD